MPVPDRVNVNSEKCLDFIREINDRAIRIKQYSADITDYYDDYNNDISGLFRLIKNSQGKWVIYGIAGIDSSKKIYNIIADGKYMTKCYPVFDDCKVELEKLLSDFAIVAQTIEIKKAIENFDPQKAGDGGFPGYLYTWYIEPELKKVIYNFKFSDVRNGVTISDDVNQDKAKEELKNNKALAKILKLISERNLSPDNISEDALGIILNLYNTNPPTCKITLEELKTLLEYNNCTYGYCSYESLSESVGCETNYTGYDGKSGIHHKLAVKKKMNELMKFISDAEGNIKKIYIDRFTIMLIEKSMEDVQEMYLKRHSRCKKKRDEIKISDIKKDDECWNKFVEQCKFNFDSFSKELKSVVNEEIINCLVEKKELPKSKDLASQIAVKESEYSKYKVNFEEEIKKLSFNN